MTTETWKADADGRCHAGCQAYCIKEGGPSWCGVEGTPTRSGRLCIPAAIVAQVVAEVDAARRDMHATAERLHARLSAVEAAVHGGPVACPDSRAYPAPVAIPPEKEWDEAQGAATGGAQVKAMGTLRAIHFYLQGAVQTWKLPPEILSFLVAWRDQAADALWPKMTPSHPPETHEARWRRLGYDVRWNNDTCEFDVLGVYAGDKPALVVSLPTVQAVDEWIAAQAPAAKARAEYGNDNDDASVDIAAAEHRTQQAERERDAALASLARVRGVLAEVLGARISLGSPSFYADGSTINERDERCTIARCLLPDLRERAEAENKGGGRE